MIKQLYTILSTPENSGKKIGLFRIICSVFGGLISAYLAMIVVAFLIPSRIQEAAVFSIMFNTLAWALFSIYIALAPTKLDSLLRFLLPTIIFSIIIYILY